MLARMACKKSRGARSMIMKPAVITLLVAVALCCCTAASAGSVEIGYVDDAGLDRWLAGGPAEVTTGETACKPAKFDETSSCGNLLISNHSSQPITINFKTSGEEFSTGMHGGVAVGTFSPVHVPLPCSAVNVSGHLEPGESCYEQVEFWPRTGDVRHCTIHVIVESGSRSTTTDFKFRGTSDYPPELQKAEEVRQRHQAELKRIPHVTSVELDNDDKDGIKIDVTVDDTDGITTKQDIEAVRHQVPPKIEGYGTEVTQYVGHGYLY
jgi:hypothetical protein